jgi:hypothetical protein
MTATETTMTAAAASVRAGDGLAEDQPAEKHGDERVHVGVGRNAGRRAVLHQPDEGGKADERPMHDQIAKRQPRTGGNSGGRKPGEIAVRSAVSMRATPPPSICIAAAVRVSAGSRTRRP